ncbi:MAG: hypothetical protein Kow00120_15110 [Anaerolineae bacterium]
MRYDMLVIGDLNVDLNLIGDDVVPEFGQGEKLVDDASLNLGGSSAIFACQAARLGLRVAFAGVVGDDVFGRFLIDTLRDRGIETGHVRVRPSVKTGITVHLVRAGDRAMLTYQGTLALLDAAHVSRKALAETRHVHSGSFYMLPRLRPGLPSVFEDAQRLGATTSLDTNFDPSGAWAGGITEVLAHTDVFLPNEQELTHIARAADAGGGGDIDAALAWAAARVPTVALKLGAEGAAARAGGETVRCAARPVEVVDTTGAGDSFDAGFLYGFLNGWPLEAALRLGCACGALSATGPGGIAAQPTLEEACAFAGLA